MTVDPLAPQPFHRIILRVETPGADPIEIEVHRARVNVEETPLALDLGHATRLRRYERSRHSLRYVIEAFPPVLLTDPHPNTVTIRAAGFLMEPAGQGGTRPWWRAIHALLALIPARKQRAAAAILRQLEAERFHRPERLTP